MAGISFFAWTGRAQAQSYEIEFQRSHQHGLELQQDLDRMDAEQKQRDLENRQREMEDRLTQRQNRLEDQLNAQREFDSYQRLQERQDLLNRKHMELLDEQEQESDRRLNEFLRRR